MHKALSASDLAEHGARLSVGASLAIAPKGLLGNAQMLARERLAPYSGEDSAPPQPGVHVGSRFKLRTKDGFELASLYVDAGAGTGSGGSRRTSKRRKRDEADEPSSASASSSSGAASSSSGGASSGADPDTQRRGVIAFHGNGMTLDGMGPFVEFYAARGVSVLLLTMRGYPGSTGDVREQGEAGMYLDGAAAVDWLVAEKGFAPRQLIAHGFSLGGSIAAAAALHHDLGALVLDHTFTSAAAVSVHVVNDTLTREAAAEDGDWRARWVPAWLSAGVAKGVIGNAFAPGVSVDLGRAGVVATDGLASVKKVAGFGGALVLIYGTADVIIPVSFADDFEAAAMARVVTTGSGSAAAAGSPAASFTRVECDGGAHCCTQFEDAQQCATIAEALGLPSGC